MSELDAFRRKLKQREDERAGNQTQETVVEVEGGETIPDTLKKGIIVRKLEYENDYTYFVQPEGKEFVYRFKEITEDFNVGDAVYMDLDNDELTFAEIKTSTGTMIPVKETNET